MAYNRPNPKVHYCFIPGKYLRDVFNSMLTKVFNLLGWQDFQSEGKDSMMKKIGFIVAMLLGTVYTAPVLADVEIGKLNEAFDSFTLGGEINVFYRYDSNPWYGSKTAWGDDSTSYGETFSRFRLTGTKDIGWATLTGQIAPYYAETAGKDFYGVLNDVQEISIDQAWLKFAKIGGTSIDLILGRQEIKIEKWFVVADGESQGAANWLYYHSSFPFAAKFDGNFGAFKSTLFYAEAGDYVKDWTDLASRNFNPENGVNLTGLNLHYDFTEKLYIYGGIFKKDEDSVATSSLESDTLTYDIGFDVTLGGLQLEGEYALQTGSTGTTNVDRDANAYFAAATYRFDTKLAPYIRTAYVCFSGDDPGTIDNEEYDPMFFDFSSWNRWIIGELVGEAQLPNQNKKDLIIEAGFSPMEPMTISLMYIQHRFDQNDTTFYGNLASEDWADEWNLFVDWPIGDHLFSSVCLGYVSPGDGAKEALGDENAFFSQLFLSYYF
jgi:hypothetical protein